MSLDLFKWQKSIFIKKFKEKRRIIIKALLINMIIVGQKLQVFKKNKKKKACRLPTKLQVFKKKMLIGYLVLNKGHQI